jgi:hypothetical protein
MLQDTRIIGRLGGVEITEQRQELQLRDGSLHWLRSVRAHGVPDKFLRALEHGGGRFSVFDVRRMIPTVDEELRIAHQRDVIGIALFTLKLHFPTAERFKKAVSETFHAFGMVEPALVESA